MSREAADPEVVKDVAVLTMQADAASDEGACSVRGGSDGAGQAAVGEARVAPTATGEERHDDTVADGDIRHPVADFLDDPRRLMPEQHRQRAKPVSVDDAEIRVAHPGRLDANQQFACGRVIESELPHAEGPRSAVRRRGARSLEHRAGHQHATPSFRLDIVPRVNTTEPAPGHGSSIGV